MCIHLFCHSYKLPKRDLKHSLWISYRTLSFFVENTIVQHLISYSESPKKSIATLYTKILYQAFTLPTNTPSKRLLIKIWLLTIFGCHTEKKNIFQEVTAFLQSTRSRAQSCFYPPTTFWTDVDYTTTYIRVLSCTLSPSWKYTIDQRNIVILSAISRNSRLVNGNNSLIPNLRFIDHLIIKSVE